MSVHPDDASAAATLALAQAAGVGRYRRSDAAAGGGAYHQNDTSIEGTLALVRASGLRGYKAADAEGGA